MIRVNSSNFSTNKTLNNFREAHALIIFKVKELNLNCL